MFSNSFYYYYKDSEWLVIESRDQVRYLVNKTGLNCFYLLKSYFNKIHYYNDLAKFVQDNSSIDGMSDLVNFLSDIKFIDFAEYCPSHTPDYTIKDLAVNDDLCLDIKDNEISHNLPEHIQIDVESLCNFDCVFCIRGGSKKYNSNLMLRVDDYVSLFDEFELMGGQEVTFSGGEPFLRHDFNEILLKTLDYGFKVNIFTNASLINDNDIQVMKTIRLNRLQVSLYGNKEDYVRFTGTDSHDSVISVLEKLKANSLDFTLTCAVTKNNFTSFAYFESLEDKYKIAYNYFIEDSFSPEIRANTSDMALSFDHEFIISKIKPIEPNEDKSGGICSIGANFIYVDIVGNVFPCYRYPFAVGNLHHRKLSDIWLNNTELDSIRRINREIRFEECEVCDANKHCMRCIAYNLVYAGSLRVLNKTTCKMGNYLYQIYKRSLRRENEGR
nr:hypothetical protein [Candidatus Cloacimonadota bacterium]